MKIIGLTGGIGSGKSMVSAVLKKYGGYVIDTDQVAHDIILKGQPAYDEIIRFFGNGILNDQKEIDRKKLGGIVFSQKYKLKKLENISHRYINQRVVSEIETIKSRNGAYNFIVIEVPLLIDSDLKALCDVIWAVYCDEKTRTDRILQRDKCSLEEAANRIKSQKNFEEYKNIAHDVIDNSMDIETLEAEVLVLLRRQLCFMSST